MKRSLRLLGDVVVVVKDAAPAMVGRILIPESARESLKEKWHRARVVAIGPGRWVHCSKCVLGWAIEVRRNPISTELHPDDADYAVHCPALEHAGFVTPVVARQKDDAIDLLRCRAVDAIETHARLFVDEGLDVMKPLPAHTCPRCIGDRPGWVLFRRQPVTIGDVVWIQESIGGKRFLGDVAKEFFGVDEVIAVPSKACALSESVQKSEEMAS
jgi:hypothetical protein